MLGIKK